MKPETALARLGEEYPAWWVDLLGEHNHVGGAGATRWLLARAGLAPGHRMLDAGAFVGAAARTAATECGARAVAVDLNPGFLEAGCGLPGGDKVAWMTAAAQRLPFSDAAFQSVWSLESALPLRELSRVAAANATLCLCTEAPMDVRGGVEAFFDELGEFGWRLAAHKPLHLEALQTWRRVEAELVARRPWFEARYSKRGYLRQLDHVAGLVRSYERGEVGHGLFVMERP
ncbi:MAG: class I SAM-dependent methyltransferase [Dehalococcoidia bacterium]